jgi:hypothetical protein
MKDPLRYYIAEGFVNLLYWPNPKACLPNQHAFSGHFYFDGRVSITAGKGTSLSGPTITVDGATYPVCDDFYLDYGTLAVDAADGAISGNLANEERIKLDVEFTHEMLPQILHPYINFNTLPPVN